MGRQISGGLGSLIGRGPTPDFPRFYYFGAMGDTFPLEEASAQRSSLELYSLARNSQQY